ncbi:MAG: hypothetical protein KIS89_04800, partial [Dokdonella sp.]|nr:hypothetical protein [Dokdonella sp.]
MSSPLSVLRAVALASLALPLPLLACEGRLHIELEQSGVYALDHAAIIAAQPGLADCRADELVLRWRGSEVPLRVLAHGERFADGDRIEWLGQQLHGPESWFDPYAVHNVYLLGAEPGPHARLREAPAPASASGAARRRLHLEQDNLMIRLDQEQQQPGEEPDVWMWAKLTQVDPSPVTIDFDLPDLDPRAGEVTLRLNLRGLSQIAAAQQRDDKPWDHVLKLSLNGHELEPRRWHGRAETVEELAVAAGWLKPTGNVLVMQVPKRTANADPRSELVDVVMFNWLEADYPLTGDVDATRLPLLPRQADSALQLRSGEAVAPALYGSDGLRRSGHALGGGRFAYAGAAAGTELYPLPGDRFLRPTSLRAVHGDAWQAPTQGYDYLIVSHPRLIEAIRPLARFHEQRGLSVAILDIDDVYD